MSAPATVGLDMARPPLDLSDVQLRELAGHVLYERRMWQWALEWLVEYQEPGPEHNAVIEAYCLHSRTLTDFFACDPTRRDDVVASDFADWRPRDNISFLFEALPSFNERLMHLSTVRLDRDSVPEESARWSNNAHHLTVIWDEFITALNPERRTWFETELSES